MAAQASGGHSQTAPRTPELSLIAFGVAIAATAVNGVLAIACTFAVAAVHIRGESPWRQIWYGSFAEGQVAAVLKREVAGERLLVLSPDIYPVYPALNYARARSTLRTMNLWLLIGAYPDCPEDAPRYREPWEMSRPEFLVYRTVAEDFATSWPELLRVSRSMLRPAESETLPPAMLYCAA